MEAEPGSIAHGIQEQYRIWFEDLQHLTSRALDPKDWTGRWYDGFSPAEALAEGPDND